MTSALKKHLDKLFVGPDDLVLFRVPGPVSPGSYADFVQVVADELAERGRGPIIVLQAGFDIEVLTPDVLNAAGFVRVIPNQFIGHVDDMEAEAHRQVRVIFERYREQEREANAARTQGD